MDKFYIEYNRFFQGFGPLAHLEDFSETGNKGHANDMKNADVLGEFLKQGPDLANLTNGTQTGVVSELIVHILDEAVSDGYTYGIGATKLFKISPSTVISGGSPSWPVTITGAVQGKTIAYLRGKLFYFFNASADAKIGVYDLSSTFNDTWQEGLEKASLLPVATKEDVMVFGHGRYVGVYFDSDSSMELKKLDFGNNHEVADVIFHGNQWLIAVNSGIGGSNRTSSQIFSYEGGATTALLSDEAAVGLQRIGFLFSLNGIVYAAYQDLSFDGGYKIGYLSGRRIEPLVHFKGSLPDYRQKTLYKNVILFPSGGQIYAAGAITSELPFSISQHAPGGYANIGAIAAPFGVPMIASYATTNFRLAKFSGLSGNAEWTSLVSRVSEGGIQGMIDNITVWTKPLKENSLCHLIIKADQDAKESLTMSISGKDKTKHEFSTIGLGQIEDIRTILEWQHADECVIRRILVEGHYI
jgi:hypothetical protein